MIAEIILFPMIDTHAHLDFPQYDADRDDIIKSGFENGLEAVINIGTDMESSRKSIELAEKYEHIYAAVGIHPHDSKAVSKDYLNRLKEMASNKKVVAIGEIGLDYYRDHSPRDIQRKVFAEQLELAKELRLPAVIHIRESLDDSFELIRKSGVRKGVLHSFPGNANQCRIGIELGFLISFAGPLTYPKSNRPDAATALPLSKILTETDSPYLTPQAFRGRRNQPEYVRYVIEKLAEIFSPYTFDDIERITSANARLLFGLPGGQKGTIVYKIRRSLYINLTNRCSCGCYFCPRTAAKQEYVAGHDLRLTGEPTVAQVLEAVKRETDFDEVVFCGLGEPTIRLKEMLEIAGALKTEGHRVRLNTNGHGSLINRIDLPLKLTGLIDRVSVSLNAHNADTYNRICRPDKGPAAYNGMLEFIEGCLKAGLETVVSVVDLPEVDIEACRGIAAEMGAEFRLRKYSRGDG